MKKTLRALIEFEFLIYDDETPQEAEERLYETLFYNLCNDTEHEIDFTIQSTECE